jgi:Domain of unknown function (DUF1877)
MGVTVSLKQISPATLEILTQNPEQIELFSSAQWLPSSAAWQRKSYLSEPYASQFKQDAQVKFSGSVYEEQFVTEWAIPELDLHKYWPELTYLLAGYIPVYSDRELSLPELQARSDLMEKSNFMEFLIIENSEWDGRPLVNAIFAGIQIGEQGADWYQTSEEVTQILDGLLGISKKGFRERYRREAKSEEPCPWFDWEEEEMLDWLMGYYREMVEYYQDASQRGNAILGHVSG